MALPFLMIELDKPRKLRLGMAAMMEFEQLTGIKLASFDGELSFEIVGKILWLMLKQDDPVLTLDDVCKLVDEYADDLMSVTEKVGEAIRAAFDTGKQRKNAGKPKA
jgi:hypothetical protein